MGEHILMWLREGVARADIVYFSAQIIGIDLFYRSLAPQIFPFLNTDMKMSMIRRQKIPILSWNTLFLIVGEAAREEILWRLPLFIFVLAGNGKIVLGAIAGLSILFGMAHGTVKNICVEGVSGVLYSVIFLKCGGFQGFPLHALVVVFLTHVTTNGIVAVWRLLRGERAI